MLVLTRNAARFVSRAWQSVTLDGQPLIKQAVIVDTGSGPTSEYNNVDLVRDMRSAGIDTELMEFTFESDPEGFLIDTPASFLGGPLSDSQIANLCPWSHLPFLSDFGAARTRGWDRLETKWATYLDSDDLWINADKLPEMIASMDANQIGLGGLRYEYRHDVQGNVCCEFLTSRVVRRERSHWQGQMHESLVHPGKSAHMQGFGHVIDKHDLHDPQSRIPLRGWKALYRQYLDGDRNEHVLFTLAMESRPINSDLALSMFQHSLMHVQRPALRSKILYEKGLLHEAEKRWATAWQCYSDSRQNLPNVDSAYGLARLAWKLGDPKQCLEFTAAGDEHPDALGTTQRNPQTRLWARYYAALAAARVEQPELKKAFLGELTRALPNDERVLQLVKDLA